MTFEQDKARSVGGPREAEYLKLNQFNQYEWSWMVINVIEGHEGHIQELLRGGNTI